jgi:hypothetical protein
MANYNYGIQRKDPNDPYGQQPAAQPGSYALQRQAPLTQGAALAQQQNTQGLQTGNFADVQSARGATDRANALRTSQALQDARGTYARAGGDYSPAEASRAQDQAFSAAEGQNVNGTNAVNQLQRQYRQDAQQNARTDESQAQAVAKGQQDYLTNRYDTNQATTESARRYDLTRGDQNSQFGVTSGQNQQQINNQASQFGQNLNQRQNEFGVTSGQTQQQINNQAGQFDKTLANQQQQFGVTAGQEDRRINNQADQFGQTLANNQQQFGVTSGQEQQKINNQASQFGTSADQEQQKINNQTSQFGVTSGQEQQKIDQAASQFAEKMGYDYTSLSQQDKQYFANLAQNQGQFDVTSGQNQQQINNQVSQFGVTSGQNQQQINNQASQYDLSRTDKNTQQGIDNTHYDQAYSNQNSLAAIDAIQDPKAKQAAYNAYMQGEPISQFLGQAYDQNGGLQGGANSPYASATPGQVSYQAKIDELKSYYPDKSDAEITKMAQDERAQDQTLSRAPAEAATKTEATAKSMQNLASGGSDPADLANLPPVTAQSIPLGADTKTFLSQSQSGGWASIGGTPYKVIGGGSTSANSNDGDYAIIQDQNGNTQYLLKGGTITSKNPGGQSDTTPTSKYALPSPTAPASTTPSYSTVTSSATGPTRR